LRQSLHKLFFCPVELNSVITVFDMSMVSSLISIAISAMLSENLITFLMTLRKAPQTLASPDFRLVELFLLPPKGMETTTFRSLSDVEFEDASSEGRCFGLAASPIFPSDFDRLLGSPGFLFGKRNSENEGNFMVGRVGFSFPFSAAASSDILIYVCVKDALRGSEFVWC